MINYKILKLTFSIILTFIFIKSQAQFSKETYKSDEVGKKGLTEIQFVGTGDVQVAISEKKDLPASTGLGAIFWRVWPNNQYDKGIDNAVWDKNPEWNSGSKKKLMSGMELQLEIKINVASTTDTISAKLHRNNVTNKNYITNNRAFGGYTLAPVSSGPSTTVNSVWYFKPKYYNDITYVTHRGINIKVPFINKNIVIKNIDGTELSLTAANQVWRFNPDTVMNVSIIGWRAGIFHEFLPDPVRRTKGYSIRLGVNYIGRSIQGDAGRPTEEGQLFRKKLLLNERTTFHGFEGTLSIRLKNIRAEASLPMLNINSKNPVPGLTGPQFITTISFVGGFPLSLN